jgi:predicted RNase H-like HicB family nuclease
MEIKLTAVFRKFPDGYAAFVEELPGVNTQGATIEEARANLKEAVEMVLQANHELAEESLCIMDKIDSREKDVPGSAYCFSSAQARNAEETRRASPPGFADDHLERRQSPGSPGVNLLARFRFGGVLRGD